MTTNNHTPTTRSTKTKIHQRQLKVREGLHAYQLNQNPSQRTDVAEIQLKGHWLIEAGFAIDAPVTVRVMEGCLVLTTPQQAAMSTQFNQLKQREQQVITEVMDGFLVKS